MAFEALKERQATMWGAAPFERIAPTIAAMHDRLVDELDPQPGERWLDVGCGVGDVAFRAARRGAAVTGSDLSPVLVETARRRAAEEGLRLELEVADCEQLPQEDASVDVLSSSVGLIFAPDHAAVAAEVARVVRPGGRIGFTAWRAEGGAGMMFRTIAAFQPPPPEGAGSPIAWGDEAYVDSLLGETFELRYVSANCPDTGETGAAMWADFLAGFGPARTLRDSLDDGRARELDETMGAFYESYRQGDRIVWERQYLLVLGTRR